MSQIFVRSLVTRCKKVKRSTATDSPELKTLLARVTWVGKDSPAYVCGIRKGHFLFRVNGSELHHPKSTTTHYRYEFAQDSDLHTITVIEVAISTVLGVKLLPSPSLAVRCINIYKTRELPVLEMDYEELIEALIMQGGEKQARKLLAALNPPRLNLSRLAPAQQRTPGITLLQAVASFKLGDFKDAENCLEQFRTKSSAFEADSERYALYGLLTKSIKVSKNELSQKKLLKVFLDATTNDSQSFNNFFTRDSTLIRNNEEALRSIEQKQKEPHYLLGRKLHNYNFYSRTRGVASRVELKKSRKTMKDSQLIVVVYAGRKLRTRVFRRFLQEMSKCYGTLIPHRLAGIHVITRDNEDFDGSHEPTAAWLVRNNLMQTYSELNLQVLNPTIEELDEFLVHLADDEKIPSTREFFSLLVDKKSVIRNVGTDGVYRLISSMEKGGAASELPLAVSVDENGEPIVTAQSYSRRARSVRRQHDDIPEAVEVLSEGLPFF